MKKVIMAMLLLVCVAAFTLDASNASPPTHNQTEYIINAPCVDGTAEIATESGAFVQWRHVIVYSKAENIDLICFAQVPEVPDVFELYIYSSLLLNATENPYYFSKVEVQIKTYSCEISDTHNLTNFDNIFGYSMASIA